MHPSRAIRGRRSNLLAGRHIVVGITGSIAAIESPRIIRELVRHGAEVTAVMSPDAARIVGPESIRFATGSEVVLQLSGEVEHVRLLGPGEGRADLYLIAPATANTISKISQGIDDTAVTSFASVALGGGTPMLLAPAMHGHMARNPAVEENLKRLRSWGVGIVAPRLIEEEEKVATPEEVAAAVLHRLARGPWVGRRVLVIGGASREPIDDVRSVTNESSGATAVALATGAYYRGADVRLWLGAAEVVPPSFVAVERWRSVGDLLSLVRERPGLPERLAAIWVPAALSDFAPEPRPGKLDSRRHQELTLTLRPVPKLLPELRRRVPRPTVLIGFKLESGRPAAELIVEAERLRSEADLDWVVANDRANMGAEKAHVVLLASDGRRLTLAGPKEEVAGKLLEDVGRELPPVDDRPSAEGPPRPRSRGRARRPAT